MKLYDFDTAVRVFYGVEHLRTWWKSTTELSGGSVQARDSKVALPYEMGDAEVLLHVLRDLPCDEANGRDGSALLFMGLDLYVVKGDEEFFAERMSSYVGCISPPSWIFSPGP